MSKQEVCQLCGGGVTGGVWYPTADGRGGRAHKSCRAKADEVYEAWRRKRTGESLEAELERALRSNS